MPTDPTLDGVNVAPGLGYSLAGSDGEVMAMEETQVERRREWRAFLFLTVFLAPILAVGLVASWGFIVWIFQMFAGPPGPQ